MKYIGTAFISAILAYAFGVSAGQQDKQEIAKAVQDVALQVGFVCGQFHDRECLNSFPK